MIKIGRKTCCAPEREAKVTEVTHPLKSSVKIRASIKPNTHSANRQLKFKKTQD